MNIVIVFFSYCAFVTIEGQENTFDLPNILDFNNARKRMTVICRVQNRIVKFCRYKTFAQAFYVQIELLKKMININYLEIAL